MPTTPQVNFNFKNENVQVSTPLLGVSHVLARTTKGKFNDPSEVISSYPQFQRIYGEEIVPDGSVSNIKKALSLGSKLRVCRVAGGNATYGYAGKTSGGEKSTFTLELSGDSDTSFSFYIRSKEQGSAINGSTVIYLKFEVDSTGANKKLVLKQATDNTFNTDSIIDSRVFIAWNEKTKVVDYQALLNFVNTVPNVDIETATYDIYYHIAELAKNPYCIVGNDSDFTEGYYTQALGSDGGASTAKTWEDAFYAVSEYTDAYNVILSHIHQHLPTDYKNVYKTIGDRVKKMQEVKLLVELPKPEASTTISDYLAQIKTLVDTVGQSQYICYYGGGIKYYNDFGVINNCDVLGTVIGIANVSEATYGPWYSYAGQNRGIVPEALGPVMQNLGSPSQIDNLQAFADWYMNLFVIKDTRSAGKRTMLWHNFTSNPISNSEKFISIVNLNLYLKKNIRPILEGKLEEPNTFSTWKDIYYEVKKILDDLVNRNAMTDPQWNGDQNAQSYSELQINNEADVRAGKYKAVLSYKDVVTMQEISLDIVITQADNNVSITVNE